MHRSTRTYSDRRAIGARASDDYDARRAQAMRDEGIDPDAPAVIEEKWKATFEGLAPPPTNLEYISRYAPDPIKAILERRRKLTGPSVYFIQRSSDGAIKIGTSVNAKTRRRGLATATPDDLKILVTIPGNCDVEYRWQSRFWHLHIRREWFRPGRDLLAAIEDLKDAMAL